MPQSDLDTTREIGSPAAVRLYIDQHDTVDALAGALGMKPSDLVRAALDRGLMVLARDGLQPMEAYGRRTRVGL
jgi:hypothetical protein